MAITASMAALALVLAGTILFDHARSTSDLQSRSPASGTVPVRGTAPAPGTVPVRGTAPAAPTSSSTPSSTTAPPTTSTSVPPAPPEEPRILIVGDSLIGQTRTAIAGLLADLDVDIRSENRTTVAHWSFYLPGLLEQEDPDVLVMALGTNDNLAYDEPPGAGPTGRASAYGGRVDALLDMTAGVPCRVWIGPSPLGFDPRYLENAPALNAALELQLIHHGVRFASWGDLMVDSHAFENDWMRGDTIHLADGGQFAYAALTAGAARQGCS